MLMASGLNHGIKNSLPHMLGIVVGFPVMLACIGLGLGVIFVNYPLVHLIIKILGSLYLLYLAWKIANAHNASASKTIRKPLTFWQAFGFQWVNPKAWVMAVGAVATFTTVEDFAIRLVIILFFFLTLGTFSMGFWLVLGKSLQKLVRSEKQLHYFNIVLAVLLALSVISMAWVEIGLQA